MARNAAKRRGWKRERESAPGKGQGDVQPVAHTRKDATWDEMLRCSTAYTRTICLCNRVHGVQESCAPDSAGYLPAMEQILRAIESLTADWTRNSNHRKELA